MRGPIISTRVRRFSEMRVYNSTAGRVVQFNYASNGDSNGMFFYFGTAFGTLSAWANPYTQGNVILTPFDVPGGTDQLSSIVNRDTSHYSTGGVSGGNYILFDLGAGRSAIVTDWLYRFRDDANTFSPTSIKLQGSNDNVSFTDLQTISGLTPSANTWVHSTTSGIVTPYRYIRYLQNGNNNSGTSHFSIGEAELYGTLIIDTAF